MDALQDHISLHQTLNVNFNDITVPLSIMSKGLLRLGQGKKHLCRKAPSTEEIPAEYTDKWPATILRIKARNGSQDYTIQRKCSLRRWPFRRHIPPCNVLKVPKLRRQRIQWREELQKPFRSLSVNNFECSPFSAVQFSENQVSCQ